MTETEPKNSIPVMANSSDMEVVDLNRTGSGGSTGSKSKVGFSEDASRGSVKKMASTGTDGNEIQSGSDSWWKKNKDGSQEGGNILQARLEEGSPLPLTPAGSTPEGKGTPDDASFASPQRTRSVDTTKIDDLENLLFSSNLETKKAREKSSFARHHSSAESVHSSQGPNSLGRNSSTGAVSRQVSLHQSIYANQSQKSMLRSSSNRTRTSSRTVGKDGSVTGTHLSNEQSVRSSWSRTSTTVTARSDATSFARPVSSRGLGIHPELNALNKKQAMAKAKSIRDTNRTEKMLTITEEGSFHRVGEKPNATRVPKNRMPLSIDDVGFGFEVSKQDAHKLPLVEFIRAMGVEVTVDDLSKTDEKYGKNHAKWLASHRAPPLLPETIGMDCVMVPGEAKFYDRTILDDYGSVIVASWLAEEYPTKELYLIRRQLMEEMDELKNTLEGGMTDDEWIERRDPALPVSRHEYLIAINQRMECVNEGVAAIKRYMEDKGYDGFDEEYENDTWYSDEEEEEEEEAEAERARAAGSKAGKKGRKIARNPSDPNAPPLDMKRVAKFRELRSKLSFKKKEDAVDPANADLGSTSAAASSAPPERVFRRVPSGDKKVTFSLKREQSAVQPIQRSQSSGIKGILSRPQQAEFYGDPSKIPQPKPEDLVPAIVEDPEEPVERGEFYGDPRMMTSAILPEGYEKYDDEDVEYESGTEYATTEGGDDHVEEVVSAENT